MRRLENGQPIRDAMKAAGMGIPALAAATKQVDPTGEGLSASYIGFIVGRGKTAREVCSDRAAQLIAAALGKEVAELFESLVFALKESTSTRRSKRATSTNRDAGDPLPELLMTQKELARYLRKSTSWIDKQIQEAKNGGRLWPGLIYVGDTRRFDPRAVLEGQQRQHQIA